MKKAFFYITEKTDSIDELWIEYCNKASKFYTNQSLDFLKDRGELLSVDIGDPCQLKAFTEEYELNHGSPKSFDNYKFEWKYLPSYIGTMKEAKDWILTQHILRSPAIAIIFENKIIIGGWVLNNVK